MDEQLETSLSTSNIQFIYSIVAYQLTEKYGLYIGNTQVHKQQYGV
jgi:hypothetical protein